MKSLVLSLCLLFSSLLSSAQVITDVDKSFQEARHLAFSSKYEEAKSLCKQILKQSPGYADVGVLLGRVYYWNKQTDSAFIQLNRVINYKPYEDAYIAFADFLRWSDDPASSLEKSEEGLSHFPGSRDLIIRKAKALEALGRNKESYKLLDSLVKVNPRNTELRQLSEQVKRNLSKNIFTVSVDYDHFDKQFDKDWLLTSIAYGKRVKRLGTVTARVNYANRFSDTGKQFELDMYPSLGKKMYMYLSGGYSPDGIFPKYRGGFSLYRNFPKGFEGELGLRSLHFNKTTVIYVGSIGKYAGNFWFSLRSSFVPSDNGTSFSRSFSFITRYYTRSANDYLTLTLGYGLSPDDRSKESLLINPELNSYRIKIGYQALFHYSNILIGSIGFLQEDFYRSSEKLKGNNISASLGYQKLF